MLLAISSPAKAGGISRRLINSDDYFPVVPGSRQAQNVIITQNDVSMNLENSFQTHEAILSITI